MSTLPKVSIAELLDAGIHFGHKTSRWNPKMAPYIYGIKDNVHIIDLRQTAGLIQVALNAIYETVKNNGKVLFVATKIQARDIMAECANKCGQYYVDHRWLGGMLTNWGTISRSIKKLEDLEKTLADEEIISTYTKKEVLNITRKKDKLLQSLGGIRNMGGEPDLIVVIDTNREDIAIAEALKLEIPIVAVVDSNSDPDNINYPIPGNDDAIRSIRLYCHLFAEAALAGIAESLTQSGVDLGAVEDLSEVANRDKTASNVTRLAPTKKVTQKTGGGKVSSKQDEEFEVGLASQEQSDTEQKDQKQADKE